MNFTTTHTLTFESNGAEWSGVFDRITETVAVEFTDGINRYGEAAAECVDEFAVLKLNAEGARFVAGWIASHAHSVSFTIDGAEVDARDAATWLRIFSLESLGQIAGAIASGGDTSLEKKGVPWSARRT